MRDLEILRRSDFVVIPVTIEHVEDFGHRVEKRGLLGCFFGHRRVRPFLFLDRRCELAVGDFELLRLYFDRCLLLEKLGGLRHETAANTVENEQESEKLEHHRHGGHEPDHLLAVLPLLEQRVLAPHEKRQARSQLFVAPSRNCPAHSAVAQLTLGVDPAPGRALDRGDPGRALMVAIAALDE